MAKRIESTERMSQAVISNGLVYLSGQVAPDLSKYIKGQTKEALAEVERCLELAGSDKDHILSATIYLKDIEADFSEMNAVWDQWISKEDAPARTTVQALMSRPECLIEISIVAYTV